MPKFNSFSNSSKININNNLVWIHDQVNDIKKHLYWILENVNNIQDIVSDIAWKKYGSQINTNEVDYKKHFILHSITFFEKGAFKLQYTQIGPDNPVINALYTKKKRLTLVE